MAVELPADAEQVLREGGLAILPTDTVYGLAAAADSLDACRRLYRLKQRPLDQPTALMLGSVELLVGGEILPGMDARIEAACRRLLPGPLTLIVPNPAGRFAHLCGAAPDRIGVRVPDLERAVAGLVDAVGGLMISSANERGGRDPARLDQVPWPLLAAAAFAVDGGELPGAASSVIDISGEEPRVVRRGPGAEVAMAGLR